MLDGLLSTVGRSCDTSLSLCIPQVKVGILKVANLRIVASASAPEGSGTPSAMSLLLILLCLAPPALLVTRLLTSLVFSPLSKVPGPNFFAITKWRLACEDWRGTRTQKIHYLHSEYGPVVRIGPSEVSFNSLAALRSIYGPGTKFGRSDFYRMFDAYSRQNLFTFHSTTEHGQRKKLLSHAYSKGVVLGDKNAAMVENKVAKFMKLIEAEPDHTSDIFNTLHYYSLDSITAFLYGDHGSTDALQGSEADRALIDDILDSTRRKLSWFTIHCPAVTKWLYRQTGIMESLVKPVLPMKKPATYTGIRKFALESYTRFRKDVDGGKDPRKAEIEGTVPPAPLVA